MSGRWHAPNPHRAIVCGKNVWMNQVSWYCLEGDGKYCSSLLGILRDGGGFTGDNDFPNPVTELTLLASPPLVIRAGELGLLFLLPFNFLTVLLLLPPVSTLADGRGEGVKTACESPLSQSSTLHKCLYASPSPCWMHERVIMLTLKPRLLLGCSGSTMLQLLREKERDEPAGSSGNSDAKDPDKRFTMSLIFEFPVGRHTVSFFQSKLPQVLRNFLKTWYVVVSCLSPTTQKSVKVISPMA
mmetsp:Transcript_2256/g.4833  ORF Transcript_2256/g.4833 Transcript_2256/m.4833 type:complete len:242 (+) Transcript_2256:398-1123(+)